MTKIDDYIESLPAWQAENLRIFRNLVHKIAPDVTEDWKWNVPVFIINGKMQFAMSAFKQHTKYNFIKNGALLGDPKKLFNNGFESKTSRGIDLKEGQTLDQTELENLIKESLQ